MAHVELALSDSFVPQPRQSAPNSRPASYPSDVPGAAGPLDRWAATVVAAAEPCLVIDAHTRIVAASAASHDLLRLDPRGAVVGRQLLDGVVRLVDFTAARDALTDAEIGNIPPLLALTSGRLARGLMRVYDGGDYDVTVDAIATPLSDGRLVVGSLTFFSPI